MTDMTDASSAGASAWERDLYAHLTGHVDAERALLKEYSGAAETSPSKALRYLVNLLIDDEIRHHRMFTELAESLRTEASLRRCPGHSVPRLRPGHRFGHRSHGSAARQGAAGSPGAQAPPAGAARREGHLPVGHSGRPDGARHQKHIAILRFARTRPPSLTLSLRVPLPRSVLCAKTSCADRSRDPSAQASRRHAYQ